MSGKGKFHTNEADPAKPDKILTPYLEIDLVGIRSLVDNPQRVDKSKAEWFIPSTLKSRIAKDQEKNGEYWILWCDFDINPKPLKQLNEFVSKWGVNYEIYSSKSATEKNQKGRILIILNKPLSGNDWSICQKLLNDLFESNGFTPDRSSEGNAQLCYLPNAGEFYQSYSQRNATNFDVLTDWADSIQFYKDELLKQEKELEAQRLAREARRAELNHTDTPNLIGPFNEYFSVQEVLLKAGYAQRGNTFRHPESSSGSYSAIVFPNGEVFTHSTDDPLHHNDKHSHDAFGAFTVLFAGGDLNAALKLAGDEWLLIEGVPFNQAMRAKQLADAATQVLTSDDTNFKLVSSIELTSNQTPTSWLVKDLITASSLGLIFGLSGSGKSFLALDIAFCIATGIDFHGYKVTQGSVVYIAGEGYAGLKKRIKALELKYGIKAPNLFISKQSAALTDANNARDVRLAIDFVCNNASLVIIDTMHRNFG